MGLLACYLIWRVLFVPLHVLIFERPHIRLMAFEANSHNGMGEIRISGIAHKETRKGL